MLKENPFESRAERDARLGISGGPQDAEPRKDRKRAPLVGLLLLVYTASVFVSGWVLAPKPSAPEAITALANERLGESPECRFQVTVATTSRPVAASELTLLENNLRAQGYVDVDVLNLVVGDNTYAFVTATAC